MVHTCESVVKNPGLEVWPLDWYEAEFGPLETNGKRRLGHHESTDEQGNIVVIVPDKPVVRIEFNERNQVQRSKEIGSSRDDVAPGMLAKRQKAIADAMMPGYGGKFVKPGTLVESLLEVPGASGSVSSASSAPSSAAHAVVACPPSSQAVVVPAHAVAAGGSSGPSVGIGGSGGARPRQAAAPEVAAAPATSRARSSGAGEKPVAKAASRGRPKKDWVTDVERVVGRFVEAAPSDLVWWGAEAKTQLRVLKQSEKEIATRIKSADILEKLGLKAALKKLSAVIAFVQAAQQHGVDTEEYKRIHDETITMLELEPRVDLDLPPHLTLSRHMIDIRATADDMRWLQRVSSTALKTSGMLPDRLEHEQATLFAERLASIMKDKDKKEADRRLRALFKIDAEYDLGSVTQEFVTCSSIVLHFREYDNLAERIDLLSEALDNLRGSIPSASSAGTPLGAAWAMWPKGGRLIDEAVAHLQKAIQMRERLAAYREARQHFIEVISNFDRSSQDCLADGSEALGALYDAYRQACDDTITEFAPQPHTDLAHEGLVAWEARCALATRSVRAAQALQAQHFSEF